MQRAHALGALERQLLGDHPAHRYAEHVGAVDAERIHEAERVARHHPRRVRVIGSVGLADTAVVERDHPMPHRKVGHLKRPGHVIAAEPHDQHQRIAAADVLVIHLDVPNPHPWHVAP